jgi:hypothetical protein
MGKLSDWSPRGGRKSEKSLRNHRQETGSLRSHRAETGSLRSPRKGEGHKSRHLMTTRAAKNRHDDIKRYKGKRREPRTRREKEPGRWRSVVNWVTGKTRRDRKAAEQAERDRRIDREIMKTTPERERAIRHHQDQILERAKREQKEKRARKNAPENQE